MALARPLSSPLTHRWLLSLLVTASAGCGAAMQSAPPKTPQSPETGRRLSPKLTTFVRFYGHGPLPKLTEAVTYELCFDLAKQQLVDVRSPETHTTVEDVVPNVLRSWRWRQISNLRLTGGLTCWQERFTPIADAQDGPAVRAEPVGDIHALVLGDDATEDLFFLDEPREDARTVATLDIIEQPRLRSVILTPRLNVVPGSGHAPSQSEPTRHPLLRSRVGSQDAKTSPHLPDLFKIRHVASQYTGSYRICVDRQGALTSLIAEVPIIGANHSIVDTLQQWHFAEQPKDTCEDSTFVFTIDHGL
jgi:hypothetical protein